MRSIVSELARQDRLVVVNDFDVDAPKTKGLIAKLAEYGLQHALIVTEEVSENLYLSSRNLHKVDVRDAAAIDPVSLINSDKVIVTVAALKKNRGDPSMNQERLFKVLLGPHITEKSAMTLGAATQVVFKVATNATKLEIRKAVEQLFEVKVDDVRVINMKGKTRRTKTGVGRRSDWKKAYVRLAEGQDIDFSVAE